MSTILICWELGGSLGHIAQLGIVMRELEARGHRLIGVFRELLHLHRLVPAGEILPAPIGHALEPLSPTYTFSQVLFNSGFDSYVALHTRIASWHTIFRLTKPGLLVCDHSPTALLAAACLGIPTCTLGLGFFSPPDRSPVELIPNGPAEAIRQSEESLLNLLNRTLAESRRPPLKRVAELYRTASCNYLATFKELDHFAEQRAAATYCGPWSHAGGVAPQWPAGDGQRIYAYLKPCPLLPELIRCLSRLAARLLIYAPEVRPDILRPLARNNVCISPQPVDMARAAVECEAAILHATHGAMAAMFLEGKPCFHIPIYLEQAILANRLVRRGAAVALGHDQSDRIEPMLHDFLASDRAASVAAELARPYRGFDQQLEVARVADGIDQIVS